MPKLRRDGGRVTSCSHSFPEEREPSQRIILAPCLLCGLHAADAIAQQAAELERYKTALKVIHSWTYPGQAEENTMALIDGLYKTADDALYGLSKI